MNRVFRFSFSVLVPFALSACIDHNQVVAPDTGLDKKPEKKCTDYASGNVVPLGSVALPVHNATDVAIAGSHAYVALGDAGLSVIDVHNSNHPKIVGSVGVDARHIAIAGELVVVTGASRLHVADVSTPSAPAILGSLNRTLGAGLAASGQFAYVSSIDHDDTTDEDVDSLLVVDLSQPGNPRIVESEVLTVGGVVHNLSLSTSGRFLYIAAGYNDADRVSTWDVSNPHALTKGQGGANILQPLIWCAVTESRAYYVNTDPPFNSLLVYGIGADSDMTGGGPDHNTYVQGMNPVCGAVCVSGAYRHIKVPLGSSDFLRSHAIRRRLESRATLIHPGFSAW